MIRARRSYYFLAVFLLPLLFLLQNPKVAEPIHGLSLAVIKPGLLAASSVGQAFSGARNNLERFWKTFQGQAKTEARIAELESELVRFQETVKENDRLKKLLEFRQSFSTKTIVARVIGKDSNPWRKTLILDKGKNQGIKKDMAVVVSEGLVGRVLETGPSASRVILITDADSRVSGLADQSRAQGVVDGEGSGMLKMTYLELDSAAAVGETVLTAGIGGLFPKGLRIGKITSLVRDETGLHLTATVEPFAKFSKLEEVLCLVTSPGK